MQNKLSKLLAKWANLEPSFCDPSGANRGCYYVGTNHDFGLVNPHNLSEEGGYKTLINGIIGALNSKNWDWELRRNTDDSGTIFIVNVFINDVRWFSTQGIELDEVLLLAYLDATQSQLKGEL